MPDCRWSVTFEQNELPTAATGATPHTITLEFIIFPLRDPPEQGLVVKLDELNFADPQDIHLNALEFLTVRAVEST
jgi:hypothetical protein